MFFLVALAASTKDASGRFRQHGRCEHVWTRQASGSLGMQSVSAAHWKSLAYPTRPTRTPPCEAQEWLIWRARTKAMMLCPWSTPRLNRIPAAHVGWQRVSSILYKVKRSMLHINLWTLPGPSQEHSFTCRLVIRLRKEATLLQQEVNTFLTHRDPPAIWNISQGFSWEFGYQSIPQALASLSQVQYLQSRGHSEAVQLLQKVPKTKDPYEQLGQQGHGIHGSKEDGHGWPQ